MGICYQNQKTNNSKLTKTTKIQTAQNLCTTSTLRLIGGLKTDSKKRNKTNTKRAQKNNKKSHFLVKPNDFHLFKKWIGKLKKKVSGIGSSRFFYDRFFSVKTVS